jgi:transglutaminase-like putative cysteine protease
LIQRAAAFAAALLLCAAPAFGDEGRRFSFRYETSVGPVEAGLGPVHVFVPLPAETGQQQVLETRIEASIPGSVEIEPTHGNRYWHGRLPVSDGAPIRITIDSTVVRKTHSVRPQADRALSVEERERWAAFLAPNARVAVGDPILEPILAEIRAARPSEKASDTARAIYDWVVDNVEYKKIGTGWGHGDTFWACNERYGNCTDFHALFISLARSEGILARSEGIPARFEIGFPVPGSQPAGSIGGYHCWVNFYLPGSGWVPIDASEASKDPEKRELYYGTHPPDRIHFTTGRDLRLGRDHRGPALNYFVYPYVEVAGTPFEGEVVRSFTYSTPTADGAGAGRSPAR